ncbi:MAG: hypothetical protein J2P25_00970 [Nocardiopsaceae bacterium]|nr:hypothetical protein [Nocardiopsaceae bacterium]
MRIKKTVIAPIVISLGSLGVVAGSVATVAASTAPVGSAVVASANPGSGGLMG